MLAIKTNARNRVENVFDLINMRGVIGKIYLVGFKLVFSMLDERFFTIFRWVWKLISGYNYRYCE